MGEAHHGVILAGTSGSSIDPTVNTLNAGSWFQFGSAPGADASARKVELVRLGAGRPKFLPSQLAAAAQANPGRSWIIGNEPNVSGQDRLPNGSADMALLVDEFESYRAAIKGADPTARIVAGNVLNFDLGAPSTCGCGGYDRGVDWVTGFRDLYRQRYGHEPLDPARDAWGMHAYPLNWNGNPTVADSMTDYAKAIDQIQKFRLLLNDLYGTNVMPLWVTELGVIWRYEWLAEDPSNPDRIIPTGADRQDLAQTFLTQMLSWLRANSTALKIERWYIYGSNPAPEPYTDRFTGIFLMSSGARSPMGDIFHQSTLAAIP